MKRVRRLNADGIRAFRSLLQAAREGQVVDANALVEDADLTNPLRVDLDVDVQPFASRLDAGRFFYELLEPERSHLGNVESDAGLWAWISAAWFTHLAPPKPDGSLTVGKDYRWIPEAENYQTYYRHLLAGPYRIFRAHADNPSRAMAVLAGKVESPGEVVEQIASMQEIVSSNSLIEAATLLYYDASAGAMKRGAGDKKRGGARRFPAVLAQFNRTWDLSQRSAAQIVAMLPAEFQRFK